MSGVGKYPYIGANFVPLAYGLLYGIAFCSHGIVAFLIGDKIFPHPLGLIQKFKVNKVKVPPIERNGNHKFKYFAFHFEENPHIQKLMLEDAVKKFTAFSLQIFDILSNLFPISLVSG